MIKRLVQCIAVPLLLLPLLFVVVSPMGGAQEPAAKAGAKAPKPAAFPPAFVTDTFLIDPQNNYYDNTKVYFDSFTQKQRVDIQILNPNPLETTVLLRYDQGKGYQFDDNGANCFSFNLDPNASLEQFILDPAAGAERTGTERLGLQRAQKWVNPLGDGKTSEFLLVRDKGSRYVIPINVKTNDGPLLVNFQEWTNVKASSRALRDQSVFDVPEGCPEPTAASNTGSPSPARLQGEEESLPWMTYREYLRLSE